MRLSRLCDNRTATYAECTQMTDRHGRDVVVAIAKASFAVSPHGQVTLAVPPSPIRYHDDFFDGFSGVRYPCDVADEKPGTDVILVGTAHAPLERSARTSADVTLRVGRVFKSLRVHGPRVWYRSMLGALSPGPAAAFTPVPLTHDLTFGVVDGVEGQEAPRIEDPDRPGQPAGFAPLAPSAPSRRRYLGTMDERWERHRAPVMPEDFDPHFYSCAAPGLWSESPLASDEPVEVIGATPEGRWMFRLPPYALRFQSVLRGVITDHPTHLDTFLIDADERRVELVWRASVALPKKRELLESMLILEAQALPGALYTRALEDIANVTPTAETP